MSDLSAQLSLVPNEFDAFAPRRAAQAGVPSFAWPTPPYAVYPNPFPLTELESCEVLGVNGHAMAARLA